MEVSWENGWLGLRVDADDVGFGRLIDWDQWLGCEEGTGVVAVGVGSGRW